jgi:glycosyltransferase involved in cell wall biosynthesis
VTRPVLLVTGEYPPTAGGVGDYTSLLRSALLDEGVDVTVVTSPEGPSEPGVQRAIGQWDLGALKTIAHLAPANAVVHVQYQAAAYALRGEVCLLPIALAALRPDVLSAVTFHDTRFPYLFPKAGPLRMAAVRLLARTANLAIATDPADLKTLRAHGHVVPIGSNIPNRPPTAYERASFREKLGAGADTLVVAYFGFLNASKGLDNLVQTLALIADRQPDSRFLVLGGAAGGSDPTDLDAGRRFEAALPAQVKVRLVRPGYLATTDLSSHLLAADVALLPYEDGASARRGSLLACLTHGLPVVTTQGPGIHDPLARAVRATAPDPSRLAEGVLALGAEPTGREAMAQAARELADSIAWPVIARRHRELYDILDSRS